MKKAPGLLKNVSSVPLPRELFSDLQLDKILSGDAVSVLRTPCGRSEIPLRNELFSLLDREEILLRIEELLSVLLSAGRALRASAQPRTATERYYCQAAALEAYLAACDALASMRGCGALFAAAADHYSSEEMRGVLSDLRGSAKRIRGALRTMSTGLLSFSDKNWLTPDHEAVSEYDRISACAGRLGFDVPPLKPRKDRLNAVLSDAICRLYPEETALIEAELVKYADADLWGPTAYIPEIRFYLEMHSLIQKGRALGIPHGFARIADAPRCTAKALYDISLLAKDCDAIVPNGAGFTGDEPFCFLLGANGGGKTTYLRAVGINLILFLAGCPVFAEDAEMYPFDTVTSHFPKDERFDDTGRLDEERERVGEMLDGAGNGTAFLLFNETFSGTDDRRGFELLADTAARIREAGHFGLYVTHFHEVMTLDYPVLSAQVDPADENRRTFRIGRIKGGASSYAADILKKYRLDKASLAERRCGRDDQHPASGAKPV